MALQKAQQFEFKITDWDSYNTSLEAFAKQYNLPKLADSPKNDTEWGPVFQQIFLIVLLGGSLIMMMRKMGGGPGGAGAQVVSSILAKVVLLCLIKTLR